MRHQSYNLFRLSADNIFPGLSARNKEQAIRFAGEQLVKGGYVQPEYVEAMLEREKLALCFASIPLACILVRKRMTAPA